jgi:hypothetical protein
MAHALMRQRRQAPIGPWLTTRETLDSRASVPTCPDRQRMGCTGRVMRPVGGRVRRSRIDEPDHTLISARLTHDDDAPGLYAVMDDVRVSSRPSPGDHATRACRSSQDVSSGETMAPRPKQWLDHGRDASRLTHDSRHTEEASITWITRDTFFHDTRHPKEMGAADIEAFLTTVRCSRRSPPPPAPTPSAPCCSSAATCLSGLSTGPSTPSGSAIPHACPR